MSIPVVAIDGPSASGKGTVARRLAERLGFHYLESGALYRLVAWVALRDGLPTGDEARLASVAAGLGVEFSGGKVLVAGRDVAAELQSEACGRGASEVARHPAVRRALLARQRAFRRAPGLVADGRDMGTVVFPDATLKVFLTASAQVRARRRYNQLIDKGIHVNLAALSRDLEERDARDAARAVAPLKAAADALEFDTSDLAIDAVVDRVESWYRERTAQRSA